MGQSQVQFPKLKHDNVFPQKLTHPIQPTQGCVRIYITIANKQMRRVDKDQIVILTWLFTCKLRHCEFFHLTGSRSLMPVIVPMYLHKEL